MLIQLWHLYWSEQYLKYFTPGFFSFYNGNLILIKCVITNTEHNGAILKPNYIYWLLINHHRLLFKLIKVNNIVSLQTKKSITVI